MENKEIEKQVVKEMTKTLDEIEAIMWENAAYDTSDMAKAFYNAGYRKALEIFAKLKEYYHQPSDTIILDINDFYELAKQYGIEKEK